MPSGNDSSDNSSKNNQGKRSDLLEKILSLEWSLAQKTRENKLLKQDVQHCKEEVADLQNQVDHLTRKSNSDSDSNSEGNNSA